MALALTHVDFAYGSLPILEDVSLAFPDRGVVCLSGPSGCGKTTLLRLLSGLEQPQRGRIEGLAGRKTAAVFQEDRLLPWMTALDNVALALPGGLRANRGRAAETLAQVGLSDALHSLPDDLSGGMKRRAAIARALAVNADLLLLDEPFTGIDPALRERIARPAPAAGRLGAAGPRHPYRRGSAAPRIPHPPPLPAPAWTAPIPVSLKPR